MHRVYWSSRSSLVAFPSRCCTIVRGVGCFLILLPICLKLIIVNINTKVSRLSRQKGPYAVKANSPCGLYIPERSVEPSLSFHSFDLAKAQNLSGPVRTPPFFMWSPAGPTWIGSLPGALDGVHWVLVVCQRRTCLLSKARAEIERTPLQCNRHSRALNSAPFSQQLGMQLRLILLCQHLLKASNGHLVFADACKTCVRVGREKRAFCLTHLASFGDLQMVVFCPLVFSKTWSLGA